MTKKWIISFLSASVILATPFAVIACGSTETKNDAFNAEANNAIALGNITGTASQVAGVYGQVDTSLTAMKDKVTDANKKKAVTDFQSEIKTETAKLQNNGSILTKIKALDNKATDYATKLKSIREDLLGLVTNLQTAYTKAAKALDTTLTDAKTKADFENLSELKGFFGTYDTIKAPEAYLLDLARLFEAFQGGVSNTLQSKYGTLASGASTIDDTMLKKYLKTAAQILNLLTKRELQTIVMAEVLKSNALTEAKALLAIDKVKQSQNTRLELAKLPTAFVTKIANLKTEFTAITNSLAATKTKSAVTGVDTGIVTKFATLENNVNQLIKRYSGFLATETVTPAFVKPGLAKNVVDLNASINSISTVAITNATTFNDLFQKASPTWENAAGSYVNANTIKNSIAALKTEVETLKTALSSAKSSETSATDGAKPNTDFETALDDLNTKIQALSTTFTELTAMTKNSTAASETSTWTINQNVRTISSLIQIYLLQMGVDVLGLNSADYAAAKVA